MNPTSNPNPDPPNGLKRAKNEPEMRLRRARGYLTISMAATIKVDGSVHGCRWNQHFHERRWK